MMSITLILKLSNHDLSLVNDFFWNGIIIACVGTATLIYEIKSWSITKQSIIQFLFMLVSVYPCLLLSGWFPLNSFLDALKIFGIFSFVGLFIWSVLFILFTKVLKE